MLVNWHLPSYIFFNFSKCNRNWYAFELILSYLNLSHFNLSSIHSIGNITLSLNFNYLRVVHKWRPTILDKALVLSSQNHWPHPPPKNVTSFFDDPFSILHFRWAVFLLVLILKRFSYASLLVKLDFNKIQLDKTEFNNCEDGTRSWE